MRNGGKKPQGGVPRGGGATSSGRANGFIPSSFRALSSYLRIVSSGASTVASTVRSAASSIVVDRDDNDVHFDQVLWAGFDKLEFEGSIARQVLLLGYRSGFQVWDVEEAHNVHDLVSKHDGPVSFLQMLPKPLLTMESGDKFCDSRPLLVLCMDGSRFPDGKSVPCNGSNPNCSVSGNGLCGPSTIQFYSLTSQSYVHILKFRSVIYSIRCSPRVVAVSQAAQVHCFNAATLEREYTILTNPVVTGYPGSGGIGYGPLALGPRWMAYSGSPIDVSNAGRVSPQLLTPSSTYPSSVSNGHRVAHYAVESSKNLAAGIVTLGDMGYKKLSQYYSELLPDSNYSVQSGVPGSKANSVVNGHNGHIVDMDSVGMVIVKDVISKSVITQFRAHKSPIAALCFDPSGTLLVTASVQGHNINVFRIMPGHPASGSSGSFTHLYRLQRGLTNAIIQDITFSDDSRWIMISSSRGTNHLFAISPFGGTVGLQFADTTAESNGFSIMGEDPVGPWLPKSAGQMLNLSNDLFARGPPVTLSVVSRIRNGTNGWKGNVNGAAAVATGKNNSLSGAVAAAFHLCKGTDIHANSCTMKSKYHLLVYSPSGSLIQYALRVSLGQDSVVAASGLGPTNGSSLGSDSKLMVEPTRKWNICQKRRDKEDNFDIYGENGSRNGYGASVVGNCTNTRSNISAEERNQLYISEAELRMHEQQAPLWARYEVYFQSMMHVGSNIEDENAEGEMEIEKIPVRTVEARSKDLIPVFDYLDNHSLQKARVAAGNGELEPQLLPHMPQNGNFATIGRPYSFDLKTENGMEPHCGIGENKNG